MLGIVVPWLYSHFNLCRVPQAARAKLGLDAPLLEIAGGTDVVGA